MTTTLDNEATSLHIDTLRRLRDEHASPEEIVQAADALKATLRRGDYVKALRAAWPDEDFPSQYVSRKRQEAARDRAQTGVPADLSDDALRLFEDLSQLENAPKNLRAALRDALCRKWRLSPRTVDNKRRAIAAQGSQALTKKTRSDRGEPRDMPQEVSVEFTLLRTDRATRHWSVQDCIREIRERHPGMKPISDGVFYRLNSAIPAVDRMTTAQRKARFEHTGVIEVRDPNEVWVFDFTQADGFVWDRLGEKPYRPYLTAILDECTRSVLFGMYTQEPPSREVLRAVMMHAILPKVGEDGKPDHQWIQYGLPRRLHCDNGKVQHSRWLQEVVATVGKTGRLREIIHAPAFTPAHQGKIERFYGSVHGWFERRAFPVEAYCGRSPAHKPEGHIGSQGDERHWKGYPTLDLLNIGFRAWVRSQYHCRKHSGVHLSPLDAWKKQAPGHIDVVDEDYLYNELLFRVGTRVAAGGTILYEGFRYHSDWLNGRDGMRLSIRVDPANLRRVLVYKEDGSTLCWADRIETTYTDQPTSMKQLELRKQATRADLRRRTDAAKVLADSSPEEKAKLLATADAIEAQRAGLPELIHFPPKHNNVTPPDPSDGDPGDDLFAQALRDATATAAASPSFGDSTDHPE